MSTQILPVDATPTNVTSIDVMSTDVMVTDVMPIDVMPMERLAAFCRLQMFRSTARRSIRFNPAV